MSQDNHEIIEQEEHNTQLQENPRKCKYGSVLSGLTLLLSLLALGGSGYTWWVTQSYKYKDILPAVTKPDAHVDINIALEPIENKLSNFESRLDGIKSFDDTSLQGSITQANNRLDSISEFSKQIQGKAAADIELLSSRLAGLPSQVDLERQRALILQLQSEVQQLNKHVNEAINTNRQRWRTVEADHLLRLADLRLRALGDTQSAQVLIETAESIFDEQNDPTADTARGFISASLRELRTIDQIDRAGIFLKINGIRNAITKNLNAIDVSFTSGSHAIDSAVQTVADGVNQVEGIRKYIDIYSFLKQASDYLRIDFDAKGQVRPVLSSQGLAQAKLALSLALEQAQWAALHADQLIYEQSLDQALNILNVNFPKNNIKAFVAEIQSMYGVKVSVTKVDLTNTLEAVDAYIKRKQSIDNNVSHVLPKASSENISSSPDSSVDTEKGIEIPADKEEE